MNVIQASFQEVGVKCFLIYFEQKGRKMYILMRLMVRD